MLRGQWRRIVAVLFLALWIVTTYFVRMLYFTSKESDKVFNANEIRNLKERLRTMSNKLKAVRALYEEIYTQINESRCSDELLNSSNKKSIAEDPTGPSEEYEIIRRRVYSNTKDLWRYVSYQLKKAVKELNNTRRLQSLLLQIENRKCVLLVDQQRMWAADGYAEWRKREASEMSALVQRRLRALQNPPDCQAARKVVCDINKVCGFGCQVHHIAYCLIYAYATERTLLLKSHGWRYNKNGWEEYFMSLSRNCTYKSNMKFLKHEDVKFLTHIDVNPDKLNFLPLAVPKDLSKRILVFNGDPASWWVGQILRYILWLRPALAAQLSRAVARMRKNNTVGVHVRRTDKLMLEARYHDLHEYMDHAEQYWLQQDLTFGTKVIRRVYLATDDHKVIEFARKNYPDVDWICDSKNSVLASGNKSRYTNSSLIGLLMDVALLAQSDYLVGTFSSQVGRLAYELMQANRPDASESVSSLDDIYYFGGQNPHHRIALLPHSPVSEQEIDLKVGDLIEVTGNHWDGYGVGSNIRTGKAGRWPWYKTEDVMTSYPFPTYDNVHLEDPTAGQQSTHTADLAHLY